jgi:hypothetical protein
VAFLLLIRPELKFGQEEREVGQEGEISGRLGDRQKGFRQPAQLVELPFFMKHAGAQLCRPGAAAGVCELAGELFRLICVIERQAVSGLDRPAFRPDLEQVEPELEEGALLERAAQTEIAVHPFERFRAAGCGFVELVARAQTAGFVQKLRGRRSNYRIDDGIGFDFFDGHGLLHSYHADYTVRKSDPGARVPFRQTRPPKLEIYINPNYPSFTLYF